MRLDFGLKYFNAVFGDSTEFPASTVLEFERHLASRIGDSGQFGGVLDELVPAPTSVFKNSRRADGGFASPSSPPDGPPRPRGHDPVLTKKVFSLYSQKAEETAKRIP